MNYGEKSVKDITLNINDTFTINNKTYSVKKSKHYCNCCAIHETGLCEMCPDCLGFIFVEVSTIMLPCPFCGEVSDISVREKRYNGIPLEVDGKRFWRVECLPCDARTGDFFDGDTITKEVGSGKYAAINAWNRRSK